jgi:hypothetical protein
LKGGKQKLECKISARIFAHKKHTSKYHSHKNDGLYTNVYNSVEKKEEERKKGRKKEEGREESKEGWTKNKKGLENHLPKKIPL